MSGYFIAIDEDGCLVIHSTKIQHDSLALPTGWSRDATLIPDSVDEVYVSHTRQLAFRAERYGNLSVETF